MTRESEDLATHVEICSIRYQGIQDKFDTVDLRLNNIDKNLTDIKIMLGEQRDSRFRVVVGGVASVIVGLLTVLGYIIVHVK